MISNDFYNKRIENLINESMNGTLIHVLVAPFICFISGNVLSVNSIAWGTSYATIAIIRYSILRYIHKNSFSKSFEIKYAILCAIQGFLIGSVSIYMDNIAWEKISFFILSSLAIMNSFVVVCYSSKIISLSFVCSSFIGNILTFILLNKDMNIFLVVVLLLIFCIFMTKMVVERYKNFVINKLLLSEKEELLKELRLKIESEEKLKKERANNLSKTQMATMAKMAEGMAHEINNPLTIIVGQFRRILSKNKNNDKISTDEIKAFEEKCSKQLLKIGKIIRGLQLFCQDEKVQEVESCNLLSILEECQLIAGYRLQLFNINFIIECDPDIQIMGKRNLLMQAITYLINNSIEAVEGFKDPYILIRVKEGLNRITIEIEDNGRGIDLANKKYIFNNFYSSKDVDKHQGLGLSISKELIHEYGGEIYLKSNGEPTIFLIDFPAIEVKKSA